MTKLLLMKGMYANFLMIIVNIAKNIDIENEEDDIAQHLDVEYIANNHPQDTFQFDVADEV